MRARWMAAVTMLALFGGMPIVEAQEERPKIAYDDFRQWSEGGENLVLLTGRPSIDGRGIHLVADTMIGWSSTAADKAGEMGIDAVYAEGNVIFEQRGMRLTMDRMYYDLKTDKGYAVNVVSRGWDSKRNQPIVIRAREARSISKGRVILDSATLTTCPYACRHYDFSISELDLKFEPDDKGKYGEKFHAEASSVFFKIGGIPLFYLPYAAFDEDDDPPIKSLALGKSRRFGYFALTDWGTGIRKRHLDRVNPFDDGNRADDDKKWGNLTFELDSRSERGYAYGLDLDYEWGDYGGFIDTYYLRDKGPNPAVKFDRQFIPLESKDRGRARAFHRHELSPEWRAEAEASYLSDRNLLQEFFEQEFKEGKEQETVAYLRWRDENRMATYLERHRLNDFQTQNEYLPSLSFAMLSEPLGTPPGILSVLGTPTFSTESQLTNIRRMYDEDLRIEDRRMWRLDSWNTVSFPYDFDLVDVTPFVGGRMTLFQENLEGDADARAIMSAGTRVGTNVHRTYGGWQSATLGMNGLRHIVRVDTRYVNNYHANVAPEELYFYDDVEDLGEFEEVSFELRNRFLTRVRSGDKLIPHEFFSVGLGWEIYPDKNRDTSRYRRQNFLPPFNWMTAAPDKDGIFQQRAQSNLYWDLTLTPKDYVSLTTLGEYNPHDRTTETYEVMLYAYPSSTLSISVDQRFVNGTTKGTTYGGQLRIADAWSFSATTLYDYRLKEYVKYSTDLTRDFHDFLLDVGFESDRARDERRFLVAITPKFLGKRLGSGRSQDDVKQ